MSAPQTLPGAVKHQVIAGFTRAAARYDTGGTEFFTAIGRRLVDLAGVHAGARVLDVGCGKGAVTLPAARLAGKGGHVTGIDLAGPMLQQRAGRGPPGPRAQRHLPAGRCRRPPPVRAGHL